MSSPSSPHHLSTGGQSRPTEHKLLSLDGGGVKGISSIMILDAIMQRVKEIEIDHGSNDKSERLPSDYFDLAGGTSTGGLAALMMFRLNMGTSQTMQQYEELSRAIFSPSIGRFNLHSLGRIGYYIGNFVLSWKAFFLPARFSAAPLEKAIDKVVKDSGNPMGGEALLIDNDNKTKMFMCSTLATRGQTIVFRSYSAPDAILQLRSIPSTSNDDPQEDMSFRNVRIKEAARATSAAPTYLPPMVIGGYEFWDGGLLNNNPIDQVWSSRYDLVESTDAPVVSCVVSIGTSWSTSKPTSSIFYKRFLNTLSATISFATNTEAKHMDFKLNIERINQRQAPEGKHTEYLRFNTPTGKEQFNLDDWQKMSRLVELTRTYLAENKTREKINTCAQILAR